jgi:hypothetical protein
LACRKIAELIAEEPKTRQRRPIRIALIVGAIVVGATGIFLFIEHESAESAPSDAHTSTLAREQAPPGNQVEAQAEAPREPGVLSGVVRSRPADASDTSDESTEADESGQDKGPLVAGAHVYLFPDSDVQQGPSPCASPNEDEHSLFGGSPCEATFDVIAERLESGGFDARPLQETVSDEKGGYRFEVDSDKSYVVFAVQGSQSGAVDGVRVGEDSDVEMSPNVSVAGTVTANEQPIAQVRVALITDVVVSTRFTTTDDHGHFKFEDIPDTQLYAFVRADGYLPALENVDYLHENAIELIAPVRVAGTVIADGRAVNGAIVRIGHRLDSEFGTEAASTRSGADGHFEFAKTRCGQSSGDVRLPNRCDLVAQSGSLYASREILGATKDVVLDLKRLARVSVKVVVPPTALVTDASVTLVHRLTDVSFTNAGPGIFVADSVPPSSYLLSASCKGALDQSRNITVAEGQDMTVEFALKPAALIAGTVVDSDGEAIATAAVSVFPAHLENLEPALERLRRLAPPQPVRRGEVDEEGKFVIDDLRPGEYALLAEDSEHEPIKVNLIAPKDGIRIVMQRGAQIVVRVSTEDNPRPPQDTRVVILLRGGEDLSRHPGMAEDDGRGNFILAGLAASHYAVRVEAAGFAATEREVDVAAGAKKEIDIRLHHGLAVSGSVGDEHGTPIPRAKVSGSKPTDGFHWIESTAGADGRFSIAGCEEGPLTLRVTAPGFLEKEFPVTSGDRDLNLALSRAPVIRGRVLDSSGRPVTTFTVDFDAVSSDDGSFEKPVRYEHRGSVSIQGDFVGVWVPLPPASDGIVDVGDIRVEVGASLDVRTLTTDGSPGENCNFAVKSPSRNSRTNLLPFRNLPEDVYTLSAWCDNGIGEQKIDLTGGDLSVELRLQPRSPSPVLDQP